MRRTEQLQGLRLMKFEDVYGRCYRGDLSQVEASEILGINRRTLYRKLRKYGYVARASNGRNGSC